MTSAHFEIDNRGIFYQKQLLWFLMIFWISSVVAVSSIIGLYIKYKDAILSYIPEQIVYMLLIFILANCILFYIIFFRIYAIEKKVYKIGEKGISQFNYFNNRDFPVREDVRWEDISTYKLSNEKPHRELYIGTRYHKFIIYEDQQITTRDFDELQNTIKTHLKEWGKENLVSL